MAIPVNMEIQRETIRQMKVYIKVKKTGLSVLVTLVVFMAAVIFVGGSASAKDETTTHNHDHLASGRTQAAANPSVKTVKNSDVLRGGETRLTMSPSNFTGDTARSYRIAREIPEALDSLHCYCECNKHSGHKSLLTCYVDEHAAHCGICQDEAFMASDLYKKGKSIKEIRAAVDKEYSNLRH